MADLPACGRCLPGEQQDTLRDVLRAAAQDRPAGVAIAAPDQDPVTYGELWERVERMRCDLLALGLGRESIVATSLPSGPLPAAAFLGLASATTMAPVNPVLTEPEMVRSFRAIRPDLVIVTTSGPQGARAAAAALGLPTADLRADGTLETAPLLSAGFDASPERGPSGDPAGHDDFALLLTTSGTSGEPKLVPLTQGNILAGARATGLAYELTAADVRLNIMPLFHVQGLVGSVVATVASGGTVVCPAGFDAPRILRWLDEHAVTWFSGSPTMYHELLRTPAPDAHLPSSLRFLRAGSAALPQPLRQRLEERFQIPVIESYGMTEAHQIASTPLAPDDRRAGAIGPPTGCDLWIAAADGSPVCHNEPGEILIRGPNVAPGYWSGGELRRDAFEGDWFRTGDVGALDAAGQLTILGRLKELINRGGEKVSPYEVEDALSAHPAVREAAVFGIPHPDYGEDVAAAVVASTSATPSERELRMFVAGRLAPYKRPQRFYFIEKIPRGLTGKIERRKVAEHVGGSMQTEIETPSDDINPVSATELALLALWRSVFEDDEVSVDDDFFAIGGDSLTGMRLLAQVQSAFGIELPPLAMYDETNTIKAMAAYIDRVRQPATSG
jgi:acyl-CoA synthetase (AMP-forming)/AMP-acid ligase II/acyl carrier protein